MMNLYWKIAPIFLLALIQTIIAGTVEGVSRNNILANDRVTNPRGKGLSPQYNYLLNDLKQFNMNRHHRTKPLGKGHAENYIRDTFSSLGLHTWTERFKPEGALWSGANIVGVLPGRLYKTKFDRVILIGAHYDTMPDTKGVDDNGSGVVAMLQVARQLTRTSSSCTRDYTVMFVAFDFEEWEKNKSPAVACTKLGCGSRAFVVNISRFYNVFPQMYVGLYGQLQGAIIMDSMMNYNSSYNSQDVPEQMQKIFPKQYNSIVGNFKRGDFLLVAGRYVDDMPLLNTFKYFYDYKARGQGFKYKLQAFPLPFNGRPVTNLPDKMRDELRSFLRSDHVSFWNEITTNRAIFLTDTGDRRGYMKNCYHKDCDDLSHVTDDLLGFLSTSFDTIAMTTNFLTITQCKSGRYAAQEEGLTAGEGGAIGVASTIAGVASLIGAIFCCRRRKENDQTELVENDQMEEGRADVSSQAEDPKHQAPVA